MNAQMTGHRPSGNGCEEKEAMTRGDLVTRAEADRRRLWLPSIAVLIGALIGIGGVFWVVGGVIALGARATWGLKAPL